MIAILLLIAIAVAVGLITYTFVMGVSGNLTKQGGSQVTDQMSLVAYNFSDPSVLTVYLQNTGASSVEVTTLYFNGFQTSPLIDALGTTCTRSLPSYCSAGQVVALTVSLGSAATSGASEFVKTVAADGAQFPYTVTAGDMG